MAIVIRCVSDSSELPIPALIAAIKEIAAAVPGKKDEVASAARDLARSLDLGAITLGANYPLLSIQILTVEHSTAVKAHDIERGLRSAGNLGLRIDTLNGASGISVAAVYYDSLRPASGNAVTVSVPVAARFSRAALGLPDSSGRVSVAATLYDQIEKSAAGAYLTVRRPVVAFKAAPQEYNYFSGYMLTSLGIILGISVIFVFMALEKKGYIKKLGVMEDQEQAAIDGKAKA